MKKKTKTFTLPTKKTIPKEKLSDYSILLYGTPGIGKTTLCSEFPDALFLTTETGSKSLSIYDRPIKKWSNFVSAIKLLKEDKQFKNIILDRVDKLYDMCFKYMCDTVLMIDHPQDEKDYGKSWGEINKEYYKWIDKLLALDKGVVMVSHQQEKEIKTLSGLEFNKLTPLVRKGPEYIHGQVDCIFYYTMKGNRRYLFLQEDDYITAKQRIKNHFFTKKGERVISINCGDSSEEAYKNLMRAYNNNTKLKGVPYALLERKEKKKLED